MVSPTKPKSVNQVSIPSDKQTSQCVTEAASHNGLITPDKPVTPDASPAPPGVGSSGASSNKQDSSDINASSVVGMAPMDNLRQELVTSSNLPASILSELQFFLCNNERVYLTQRGKKNFTALPIGSKQSDNFIRRRARKAGVFLNKGALNEFNDEVIAHAELSDDTRDVWCRVAAIPGGIALDAGDNDHTHIQITPGKVNISTEGSDTHFYRTPGTLPFVKPADDGDLALIDKYLNLHPTHIVLLMAYVSYTLAHPKVSTTNYLILVLRGDQGSGKSFLCWIIQALLDPRAVGVQTFPSNRKDFVIAAQHAHALFYDNMRDIKPLMADLLCMSATGGALTTRELYTNGEQHVHWLHAAVVLNGIHDIITQPDLAHRVLSLYLLPIDEKKRRSESAMVHEFQTDLPKIFRGLLDLIANILTVLPSVEPTNPERMFGFSHWLAAYEKVDGAPPEAYQLEYSKALNGAMLDSLMENPLAAAMMSFVTEKVDDFWTGTPTDLLQELNFIVGKRTPYSKDWPQNPIALSKRLQSLQGGLKSQGIEIILSRGKNRKITVARMEGVFDE
jgi:hypothetical protein